MTDTTLAPAETPSSRDGLLMLALCLLFGIFGAHRFYAGRTPSAIVQLLTLGGLGIWVAIDLLYILFGAFTDEAGQKVDPWKDM